MRAPRPALQRGQGLGRAAAGSPRRRSGPVGSPSPSSTWIRGTTSWRCWSSGTSGWPSWTRNCSWPRYRTPSTRAGGRTSARRVRNRLQSVTLLDAIAAGRFDACIGGARRDEDKARAKERVSPSGRLRSVGPAQPAARALAPLPRACERRRAPAGVPAVGLDRARRVELHPPRGHRPPLALLRARATGGRARRHACRRERVGAARRGRGGAHRTVRFRTVGDATCTGAVRSTALTVDEVITEIVTSRVSDRAPPGPTTGSRRRHSRTGNGRGTSSRG